MLWNIVKFLIGNNEAKKKDWPDCVMIIVYMIHRIKNEIMTCQSTGSKASRQTCSILEHYPSSNYILGN